MPFVLTEVPKSVNLQRLLTSIHIHNWLKNDLFHSDWWFLIGLVFVSLLVWWCLLDKSRLNEICLYTALAAILSLGIVEYGEELTLWDYPTDIIPIFPPLTSINLFCLPLIYSLTYQHFNSKKSFVWATVVITSIICFIIEPILAKEHLYQLLHWKYFYSLPIYFTMAIFIRIVVISIYKTTQKSGLLNDQKHSNF